MKLSFRLLFSFLLLNCFATHAQEMQFLGIPFGSDIITFSKQLIGRGFEFIEMTSSGDGSYSQEKLKGDFWKIKDCEIQLCSYTEKQYTTQKSFPVSEARVTMPTGGINGMNSHNLRVQQEEAGRIFSELVNDLYSKYGSVSKETRSEFGDYTIEWHRSNGNIIVMLLCTNTIIVKYVSSIRLRQLEEQKRFKGNGKNDL